MAQDNLASVQKSVENTTHIGVVSLVQMARRYREAPGEAYFDAKVDAMQEKIDQGLQKISSVVGSGSVMGMVGLVGYAALAGAAVVPASSSVLIGGAMAVSAGIGLAFSAYYADAKDLGLNMARWRAAKEHVMGGAKVAPQQPTSGGLKM